MSDTIFGKRLKQLRENKKISQKDFAKILEVTPATLSTYEKAGKYPAVPKLIEIAKKIDVSIDWLLGVSDDNSKRFEIKNHSELFAILLALQNCTHINTSIDNEKHIISIGFTDCYSVSFIDKYYKVYENYKKKIIDKDFLDLWISTQLTSEILKKSFKEIEKQKEEQKALNIDTENLKKQGD